jgi:hypothetical protein
MSDDNKVKDVADRLRGRNGEQALSQAREAGKQLAAQTGKMQEAREVSGPKPTPRGPEQSAGDPAVRHRQILDQKQNGLVNSGRGAAPAPQAEPAKAVAEKQPAKDVAAVAKDQRIAEAAKGFREAGVSGGKAANDVGRAAPTPAVQQQNRGRGR